MTLNAVTFLQDPYLGSGQPSLRSLNLLGSPAGAASGSVPQHQQQQLGSIYSQQQQQQQHGVLGNALQSAGIRSDPDADDSMDDMLNMFLEDS